MDMYGNSSQPGTATQASVAPPHLTKSYMEMMKSHALRLQELDDKYRSIFLINPSNQQSQGSAQYGIRGSGSTSSRHVSSSARKASIYSQNPGKERTASFSDAGYESQKGASSSSKKSEHHYGRASREPSFSQMSQPDSSAEDEDKFVTLKWIFDTLLSQSTDSQFIQDFVLTMNMFISPEELLALLKKKFNEPVPPDVPPSQIKEYIKTVQNQLKIRIFLIIEKWIDTTWNSSTDPMLVSAVKNFVDSANMKISATKINRLIDKKIADEESKTMTLFAKDTPPPRVMPFIEADSPKPSISIFTISIVELARQETLVEHRLFHAIKLWEFQNLNFTKKDKSLAPNIHAFIKHFNAMSNWLTKMILDCTALSKRIRAIELLIDLAEAFLQLNNFNGLLVVVSTLLSSSIFRLKLSWNSISRGHKARMKEYTDLSSNAKNFSDLRNRMKQSIGPCVPYIGLFQTDLTFIEEGNPTKCGDLINWQKCKLLAGVIRGINEYRMNSYSLVNIPWIQDFLESVEVTETEDDFWDRSTALESRADIQNAKSSQESGSQSAATPPASPSRHQRIRSTSSLVNSTTDFGDPSGNGTGQGGQPNVIKVSIPGFTSFFETPYPGENDPDNAPKTGLALKEYIFSSILSKLPKSKLKGIIETYRDKMNELTLVEFSELNLYGKEIGDNEQYSVYSAAGLKFLSFFTCCCPVQVTYGKSSAVILAELESPLHSLISSICSAFAITSGTDGANGSGNSGNDNASGGSSSSSAAAGSGKEANEFALLMCDKDNRAMHWLNRNISLRRQGFKESYKIYVYPTSLLSDREIDKSVYMHNPCCKTGYLTKVNVRPLMRHGFLPRSSSTSSGGSLGQSNGLTLSGRDSATVSRTAPRMPRTASPHPMIPIPPPATEPPKPDGSGLGASGRYHSSVVGGQGASLQRTNSSLSFSSCDDEAEDGNEKNWFLAVDGFLFYFKEFSAPKPRRVFLLEYYNVTLGTISGGQPCIVLRMRPDYPFRAPGSRMVLLTTKNEADLRAWYADLRHRSCICRRSRVFGVPQGEIALRSSSTTFIPKQIQACINKIFMYGPGVEGLFTSALPSLSSLERVKDGLDAGEVPESHTTAELGIVAQALLSYFAELPEPIFTQEMVTALGEASEMLPVLNYWLAEVMSPPQAFALVNLALMLSAWNESMPQGSKRQGASVLCQYMPGPEKKTIKVAEELLKVIERAEIPPERRNFKAYVQTLPPPQVLQSGDTMFILSKEEVLLISRLISSAFSKGSYKATLSKPSAAAAGVNPMKLPLDKCKQLGDIDASPSSSIGSPERWGARKNTMSSCSENDPPGFAVMSSEQADEAISMQYEMFSAGSSSVHGGHF